MLLLYAPLPLPKPVGWDAMNPPPLPPPAASDWKGLLLPLLAPVLSLTSIRLLLLLTLPAPIRWNGLAALVFVVMIGPPTVWWLEWFRLVWDKMHNVSQLDSLSIWIHRRVPYLGIRSCPVLPKVSIPSSRLDRAKAKCAYFSSWAFGALFTAGAYYQQENSQLKWIWGYKSQRRLSNE